MSIELDDVIKKLNDPELQARVRSAVRDATVDELRKAGIDLTPAQWGELTTRVVSNPSAREAGDVLAGAAAVIIGIAISDARVKNNIEFVGTVNGLRLYEFSYVGFRTRWRGLIAQDVQLSHPSAVYATEMGVLAVDYDQLGLRPVQV